jgi:hypothetical protein
VRRPSLFGSKSDESRSGESAPREADKAERTEPKAPPEFRAQEPKSSSPSERRATIRHLDRADMAETFADSITSLTFDGQTLRIEFGVTRLDNVQANTPISGRRYPACRLVLPPTAAVDLINRMQQIAAALRQAGVVKPTQQSAPPARRADER